MFGWLTQLVGDTMSVGAVLDGTRAPRVMVRSGA